MQRPLPARLVVTALALAGALFTTASAFAQGEVHLIPRGVVTAPQPGPVERAPQPVRVERDRAPQPIHVQRAPQPVHVQRAPQPVYVQHAPQPRYVQAGGWNSCAAPRWNPQARYMPGQLVRRQGNLYIATDVSAAVWNVNSPPEWTPSYWVPAVCAN